MLDFTGLLLALWPIHQSWNFQLSYFMSIFKIYNQRIIYLSNSPKDKHVKQQRCTNVETVKLSDVKRSRLSLFFCFLTPFLLFVHRAGGGWVPREPADPARDLQLVHNHFCILPKESGKLEGNHQTSLSPDLANKSRGSWIFSTT